ncbi:peptidylprolyl isomerase [Nautilia lithotrophica]
MIEWMQTHRKWLVITIWIATIAFIGAGFVGWGQFQFGRKSSTVAKIKDTEVSIQDVQEVYNNLFQEKNRQLGGTLDDATAEKMGLKKQAFDMAIQQGILRQYAKDLGMYVTDEEVAKQVLQYFKDKKTYIQYLTQTGQKAKDFEEKLKKQLLIQKLLTALHIKPSKTLQLTFASALYNSDNLEIKIINKSSVKVNLSEDEIKAFWEQNKDKYQSPTMYKIAIVKTPIKGVATENDLKAYYNDNKTNYRNDKGEILTYEEAKNQVKKDYLAKISKKDAIIAYKKLKEGAENYELLTLTINNKIIPAEKMQKLIQTGYLKPFVDKDEYISAKLVEEIKPKPLPYEKAKALVTKDLLHIKTLAALENKAKETLNNFSGLKTGFVTKYDANKIKGLTPEEATEFLFTEFSLEKNKNYLLIPALNPQKAVVYKVLEQKLLDKAKFEKNKDQIAAMADATLNAALLDDLIKDLMAKYNIVSYVK